jgi:CheY-like chemotaxis protein/c-di-GMP-binding flagellar brake protein YcgR
MPPVDPGLENLFHVGLPVIIDAEPTLKNGPRFGASIRGWQPGEYLILDLPPENPGNVTVSSGQRVVVRFMSEGVACAFPSSVQAPGTGPYHSYFRVMWPRRIERVCVRKQDRVEVNVPCIISRADYPEEPAEMLDVSAGGCNIHSMQKLTPNTIFSVTFTLPDGGVIENLRAIVKNAIAAQEGGYSLGCAFIAPDESQKVDLEFYVVTSLDRRRGACHQRAWVLVIDTDADRTTGIRRSLAEYGVMVVAAASGLSGLARLGISFPTAVLIAAELGGCTAADLTRVVRSVERGKKAPVYVYENRGQADDSMRSALEAAGVTRYFVGADMTDRMVSAVMKLVEREEGQGGEGKNGVKAAAGMAPSRKS